MAFASLKFPPGIFRNGTRFQSRGRWYDANLVRWYSDAMQPVGGWSALTPSGPVIVDTATGGTGFGDTDEGNTPTGWQELQLAGDVTPGGDHDWKVNAEGALELADIVGATKYAGFIRWSTVTPFADGDVLMRGEAPQANGGAFGVGMRMPATGSTGAVIGAIIDTVGTDRLVLYANTGITSGEPIEGSPFGSSYQDDFTLTPAPTPGDTWYIRLNVDGTTARAKAWVATDTEPVGWQATLDLTTVPAYPTAAGVPCIIADTAGTTAKPRVVQALSYSPDPAVSAPFVSSGTAEAVQEVGGIDEAIVSLFGWRDNDNVPWLAIGTPTRAFMYSEGLIEDITPSGFVTGLTDASVQIEAYGLGAYGAGVYGVGVTGSTNIQEAQSWQFDNFGEFLVAVAHSDGKLYNFQPNTSETLEVVANAPTDNAGVVVTPEKFLVALGAGGDPRKVQWADIESLTSWTVTPENQAGDLQLATQGAIMCGQRGRGATLIWTNQDFHTMQYIGGTLVYRIDQVGTNCGIIGRDAYAMMDGSRAVWMGQNAFFLYDGNVRPLQCEVLDYIFQDINRTQASKIRAFTIPEYESIMWLYPSAGQNEVDRYVVYNYGGNFWEIGQLKRTAAISRGAFDYPIMADRNGILYEHEKGTTYLDIDGETALVPYAESGPMALDEGDRLMYIREIIPDENTLGDLDIYLKTRLYPTAAETVAGPYTAANPTPTRAQGRQAALRVVQVSPGWRLGHPRLDVVPTGGR